MGLLEKQERYTQARRPLIFRMLALLAVIYSGFALYVFFFADRMIFLPPAVGYEHAPNQDKTAVINYETLAAIDDGFFTGPVDLEIFKQAVILLETGVPSAYLEDAFFNAILPTLIF